jgi:hypothetical protein
MKQYFFIPSELDSEILFMLMQAEDVIAEMFCLTLQPQSAIHHCKESIQVHTYLRLQASDLNLI